MTHDPTEDTSLDAALAELSAHRPDVEAATAERTRRAAQRVFAAEVALRDRPLARTFDRVWVRRLEPALLAGSSAGYLVWALLTVSAAAR
jgi:hypothetical protein